MAKVLRTVMNLMAASSFFTLNALGDADYTKLFDLENSYEKEYQEFARIKYDLRYIEEHRITNNTAKNHWLSQHHRYKKKLTKMYSTLHEYRQRLKSISSPMRGHSKTFNQSFDVCPTYTGRTALEKQFLTSQFGKNSCVFQINRNQIQILNDQRNAFGLKVKSLLGKDLSEKMYKTANPFLPIDFSKAPKLDEILISSLVFEKDFSGKVLSRIIEHHAKRGTKVKIIIAKALLTDESEKMFSDLRKKYKSLKIKFYRYKGVGRHRSNTALSRFHKVNHVKILAVKGRKTDVVFMGGRNIHDGFLFPEPIDHSKFPELTQRSQTEYSMWEDMDLKLTSKKLNRSIRSQYMSFWNHDRKDMFFNISSIFVGLKKVKNLDPNKIYIRHFLSAPYADQVAFRKSDVLSKTGKYISSLEKYTIQVIDSAKEEIKLISPYFNLTNNIHGAVLRAVKRGVDVKVITRIDLEGDTVAALLSEVNKGMINRLYDRVDLYEYLTPRKILHSKILLVDKKFTIVGSVNYNKRSFIHDPENFVSIWSPKFNREMSKIFEGYKKDSRKIRSKQSSNRAYKLLLDSFETYF